MKKQYGNEEGEKIYFATIRKKAMQNAGYEPEGETIQEGEKIMKGIVDRFRDKMKEREEKGEEAEKCATCGDCVKFPCECDDRARKTSMDLYKNKLRSMGLKMSYEPEGEMTEARNPEVEAQGKKVAGYEKEGKYQGITSKFRKENPGSRQKPKARGSKPTEGELTQARIQKHNQRVAKHGFTSKEKKESEARERYDSPRD